MEIEALLPEKRVAQRYVPRMFDAPLPGPPATTVAMQGPVLILGDNADAMALKERFQREGLSVRVLPATPDADAAVAELERIWKEHPAANLFVMTVRDPDAAQFYEARRWTRRERGFYVPFFVIQRWLQLASKLPQPCPLTLAAAINLGGNYGFSGPVPAPEGGAIAGLLKSIHLESVAQAEP